MFFFEFFLGFSKGFFVTVCVKGFLMFFLGGCLGFFFCVFSCFFF